MRTLVSKAAGFAKKKHAGQLDDEGRDYYFAHLLPVVMILGVITQNENILAAGYLHDTLEDTDTTVDELRAEFGDRVTELVLEVTHEGKKDDKGFYFPRLNSREGVIIKFADRLSNLSRMSSWESRRQEQYLKRSKFWKSSID
jgi:(p)ppGpp synthase/HD superfamily hydrolase